jgi:hypothetical protein
VSDLRDVRRVTKRLLAAVHAYADVVETLDDAEALAFASALLDRSPEGAKQQLAIVADQAAVKLHFAVLNEPNRTRTFEGLGTVEASWTGGSATWEGRRLAHVVAARAADRSAFDPTTGALRDDPLSPGALAEFVADEIVACAGLDAASKAWRKEDLRKRHIDPDLYHTRSGGGRRTVRWL